MRTLSRSAMVVLLALALAGCQRVNYDKSYSLRGFEFDHATFSAPRYTQKIAISVSPTSQPVCAYVVKSSDREALETILNQRRIPPASMVLASRESREKAEEYSFEGTIPNGTEYTVLVYNAGKQ